VQVHHGLEEECAPGLACPVRQQQVRHEKPVFGDEVEEHDVDYVVVGVELLVRFVHQIIQLDEEQQPVDHSLPHFVAQFVDVVKCDDHLEELHQNKQLKLYNGPACGLALGQGPNELQGAHQV